MSKSHEMIKNPKLCKGKKINSYTNMPVEGSLKLTNMSITIYIQTI